MPDLYLGIDTSNYKTSVALTDPDNRIVFSRSEYLDVEPGSRGLRQSEAFFRHSNRLPAYIEEMSRTVSVSDICAAGVSSCPRRTEGSYMPCFLAGVNAAKEIASVLGIPLHEFSHQEGHAAAVIEDDCCLPEGRTAFFHLSGGTTEFLVTRPDEAGYDMQITGGTRDISIGQLIDRAGVAMGYPFPSGSYLDELACSYYSEHGRTKSFLPKIKITDGHFNLSGIETRILREIEGAHSEYHPEMAYSIFESISVLLAQSAEIISAEYGTGAVYMAGGVSASRFIRESIMEKVKGTEIIFGDPLLSGDNAVGIARLARRIHETGNRNTGK